MRELNGIHIITAFGVLGLNSKDDAFYLKFRGFGLRPQCLLVDFYKLMVSNTCTFTQTNTYKEHEKISVSP